MRETSAIGAAIAAGLAFGLWRNFEEMQGINGSGASVFQPHLTREQSAERFAQWDRAVKAVKAWSEYNKQNPSSSTAAKNSEDNKDDVDPKSITTGSSKVSEDIIGSNTHEVGLADGFDGDGFDDQDNDEDDLMMEIRRIEMMQRLKKLKKGKAAYM